MPKDVKIARSALVFFLFIQANLSVASSELGVAIPSYIETYEPSKGWSFYQRFIMNCVYQRLFSIDQFGQVEGELAESWFFSKSGKTLTLTVSDKARFSDGSPVTLDDIFLSLSKPFATPEDSYVNRVLGPAMGLRAPLKVGEILPNLKRLGGRSFAIEMQQVYLPLIDILGSYLFPVMKTTDNLLGSGPYIAKKERRGLWTLYTNPFHQEGAKKIKKIKILTEFSQEKVQKLIQNKEIHFAMGFHLRDLQDQEGTFTIKKVLKAGYNHFYFNLESRSLKDKSFRAYLGHILKDVARNHYSRFEEFVPRLLPRGLLPLAYHSQTVAAPKVTLQQTKLNMPRSRIKLLFVGRHFADGFFEELQAALDKSGIDGNIEILKGPEYNKVIQERKFDVISYPVIPSYHDPDGYFADPTYFSICGDKRTCPYKKMLLAARYVKDKTKRSDLFSKLFRKIESDWILVPGFKTSIPIAISNDLILPPINYRDQVKLWKMEFRNAK